MPRGVPNSKPDDVVAAVEVESDTEIGDTAPQASWNIENLVTMAEFDRVVKHLQNEISGLKELVADLERVITAPAGSIEFYDVHRNTDIAHHEDAPWYNSDRF